MKKLILRYRWTTTYLITLALIYALVEVALR